MSSVRRLGASFVGSVLLHGAVLALLVRAVGVSVPPLATPIRIALVGKPGGGGGAAGPLPEAQPAPATSNPPVAAPASEPARRARWPVAHAPVRAAAPPATSAEAPGGGDGVAARGGEGGGGGDGSGGDGSGGAHVAYGANPLPPYPYVARRLRKEGVVLLEVVVAADGHAADVRVVRSSGFVPLDESAVTTVRERWRFVPARRGGQAVESRVAVPIRFRIEDAQS